MFVIRAYSLISAPFGVAIGGGKSLIFKQLQKHSGSSDLRAVVLSFPEHQ